ncbi:ACP S-malonyltransferase [Leptospira wolffii]|uniref:ACP S-malonyltransferase n=1 Tax=Leptospira wolffii TaxID=409998 RepID=UPI001083F631|nr:ACP S-malonyltransferase [Leptospira wolffii]TGK61702.1 ACP S-malonyltransferase [Leptospira wolffii]TGK70245.1 ACP S-malonyltransferase [Leptospira wolffii]TGK77168.1 ACP S-malonyltransferase [Leptospira wolffii]TGL30979.1 ACP S-malonyltransferase [Leptospira wolffii]
MAVANFLNEAKSQGNKLFLQFGGQGSPWLKELSKLYESEPSLKEFFETAFKTLAEEIPSLDKKIVSQGYDFESWLKNPDSAPDESYLSSATVSIVGIFLTQTANYVSLTNKGFPTSELLANALGATGHSQGIVPAVLVSLGKEGAEFYKEFSKFLKFILYLGYRAQELYGVFNPSEEVLKGNEEIGDKQPAPMVAVIGYSAAELSERVQKTNAELGLSGTKAIYVSLFNTPDSNIVSGDPEALLAFRKKFKAEMDEKKVKFVYLRTTAPFHCPIMDGTENTVPKDMERIGFQYKGSDLKIPVYSIFDGRNFQNEPDVSLPLFREVLIKALHWDKATANFVNTPKVVGIDFGPSVVSQKLTQANLGSSENKIYSASSPKDIKVLLA